MLPLFGQQLWLLLAIASVGEYVAIDWNSREYSIEATGSEIHFLERKDELAKSLGLSMTLRACGYNEDGGTFKIIYPAHDPTL